MNRGLDLAVAIACALATTPVVLLAPFVEPVRIGLGLVFVLFLPGYVLVAALYPRKDDLDLVERVALSLGLSIAVVPLIGLGLNYSPWGIRLNPILAFVTLFIVLAASVAMYRRLVLPSNEAMGLAVNLALPAWRRVRVADRLLGLLLVLTLAGLGVGAYFLAISSAGDARRHQRSTGGGGKEATVVPFSSHCIPLSSLTLTKLYSQALWVPDRSNGRKSTEFQQRKKWDGWSDPPTHFPH